VWYWLNNRHLYGNLREGIAATLLRKTPITAEIAGVKTEWATEGSLNFTPWTVSDAWVAKKPAERAKLAWMTFAIEAPLPIRTQFFKHKHGFVENEVSRRYVSDPPSFFVPEIWRGRAPSVKQGSTREPIRHQWLANLIAQGVYRLSDLGYRTLLALDVCPEQARFLPSQGMMTQWYWTGSLDAIARAYKLRADPHAQEESCQIATQLRQLAETQWPETSRTLF